MILKLLLALFLTAAIGAPAGYVAYQLHQGSGPTKGNGGGAHGVPGPLAGAGLPFIAVGYGVYWLVRRRRNTQ
jgi:hypothetical protein